MDPSAALIAGVIAATAFPIAVVIAQRRRERIRNRKAGRRKTQKIRL